MKLTVGICTWNRCQLLAQTLEQMTQLRIPAGVQWELLVVNNRCTDDTDAVLKQYQEKLPLQRLLEEKQGHSHSRNCVIDHAQGEYILWTDDDVLVDADWISHYLQALKQFPDASFFGGTIDPLYEIEPPGWAVRHLKYLNSPFALRQFGPEIRPLQEKELPMGANMMMPTELMRKHRFNTELGRKKDDLISGDETDMFLRFREQKLLGIWVGPARVEHFIPKERLTLGYIWNWFQGAGRTDVLRNGIKECTMLWDAPRWAWKEYAFKRLLAALWRPTLGSRWLTAYTRAATLQGIIEQSQQRAVGKSAPCV